MAKASKTIERTDEFWNRIYGVFDPGEVLAGERGDKFYCTREHDPLEEMKMLFRGTLTHARPPKAFLAGHRGSGKSSLLIQLLQHCTSGLFVVYFDIEHNLEPNKANHIDLLYLLGVAIHAAAQREGYAPDDRLVVQLGRSVDTITRKSSEKPVEESFDTAELVKGVVVFTAGLLGSKPLERLADALLKPFKMSSGVSEEIARDRTIEPHVQEVLDCVNLIIDDVQKKAGRELMVIVDGLDKLPVDLAKLVFLETRALLDPICRTTYTMPMPIQAMKKFQPLKQECSAFFLHNIKLFDRDGRTDVHAHGYAVLREVATKRLAAIGHTEKDVFEPDVLDFLIAKSGGVLRWYIDLVQEACMKAVLAHSKMIGLTQASAAVGDQVASLTLGLDIPSLEELRLTHKEKRLSGTDAGSELLHGLYIVAYRNDKTWYDAHPLLWDEL
jgi:hypothetical protein